MKKFLIKTGIFFLIVIAIGSITAALLPYHWGNAWYGTKIEYLNRSSESGLSGFNSYYFGSSRVFRQFNPAVFDSVVNTNKPGKKLNSFNLGAPATFTPQVYYLLEHFLQSEQAENTDYILIELDDISTITAQLLHQPRTNFWLNTYYFTFVLKSEFVKSKKDYTKLYQYVISYTENVTKLGQYKYIFNYEGYHDDRFLGNKKNGFFTLENDLKTTTEIETRKHLLERRSALGEQMKTLNKRAENSSLFFKYKDDSNELSVHKGKIKELIDECSKRNIQVVFILMPRKISKEVFMLYNWLPDENKIQLVNAEDYPELYMEKYSFDLGHLNKEGANIFTKYLAEEFLKKSFINN